MPPGEVVIGPIGNTDGPSLPSITTGADANIYVGAIEGGFIPTEPATVVRTSVPTQFVRFYNQYDYDTLGPADGPWIATTNSVRGLTAEEIKNVLALPDLPNAVAIVQVPAGTCVLGGPGNPALGNFPADPPAVPTAGPWGAAGVPQYYIVGQTSAGNCADPENLPETSYIALTTLGTKALAYEPNAGTGNPAAVASALDNADYPQPFTPMDSVYNSLDLLNFTDADGFRGALAQLSGEGNADIASVSLQGAYNFLGVLRNQFRGTGPSWSSDEQPGRSSADINLWLDVGASTADINGNGDTHGLDSNFTTFAGGIDYKLTPAFTVGAALGYSRASFSVDDLATGGNADNYYATVSGSLQFGLAYIDAVAGYARSDTDINRSIAFVGQQGTTVGDTAGDAFIGAIEAGYRFDVSATTSIIPNVGLQVVSLHQDAFTEQGAEQLDLAIAGRDMTAARSLAGMDVRHRFDLGQGDVPQGAARQRNAVVANLRVAWAHDVSDPSRSVESSFVQLPSASFVVYGPSPDRDAAVIGLGLALEGAVTGFVRYDGEISGNAQSHAGSIGVKGRF
ncbi:autotransporter outer membrane beta-barrel domain-containing protein [Ancylobacter sp. Lp-2]|uniref:autotransporter outer membrane beta-barrel domain-containing protein n=1 Tax=Ancylobacter sp. Lp-2 TaxID=2881339 RepID=UPI001E4724EC|nr:autotransporter outer membrane beta-barrel domain-containing protein [Ancylobacter sp. Lp-2]MCB4767724.1 autotransporter outer membrane beta-barrel domain-containing protein [Ancylobacter sp. Lp-2]